MKKFARLFLGLIGLAAAVAIVWRFASRRYALPCPTWLGWLVELDNPFVESQNVRSIIQRMNLALGMQVLDLGCGPGRLAVPIAQEVGPQGQVTAVDIQPAMLRRAQEKARAANVNNIRFVQAGAGEGKLGRDQYDRALLVTVLGEIPDRQAALQEVFDALKPGGVLTVTEIILDPHFQSRNTILRLANAAGFREKAFFGNRFSFTLNLEKPATIS